MCGSETLSAISNLAAAADHPRNPPPLHSEIVSRERGQATSIIRGIAFLILALRGVGCNIKISMVSPKNPKDKVD